MLKFRVLVVDDAVVMRRLITEAIADDPELELAGIAANGKIALARIPQVNPDIVTLDIEMPEMDGLATVREIRRLYPRLPVVMFSTLSRRGAEITLEAMAQGASDYVTKPANIGSVCEGVRALREELVPRLKLHARRYRPDLQPVASRVVLPPPPRRTPTARGPVRAVTIGTSTGGTNALAEVFGQLPANPSGPPYFLVQHMPPVFTALLAERLTKLGKTPVREAQQGERVESGIAYLAPGGRHMEVKLEGGAMKIVLHDGPPENSCRPAVDPLFRSVARAYGAGVLAVVLTGMGQDGLIGCRHVKEFGGCVLIQDESSSVVWGMPGAVAAAGLADDILPLSEISRHIAARLLRPVASPVSLLSSP